MSKKEFVNLSSVVAGIEPRLQLKYVPAFQRASKNGQVDSVPVEKTFAVRGSSFREHVVLNDARFQSWHLKALKDIELRAVRGAVAYEDDLKSGEVDFLSLVEQYRKNVKRTKTRGKPRKPRLGEAVTDTTQTAEDAKPGRSEITAAVGP
ncbi:hypothetical protein [Deinococcus fonticola]|uniref:hypothetical protein n=1 Tax=Deinococcus fonticola TaxID=2528713 RepID=UPI0010750DFC|nr:hypothetical protein [Deinococcus fonticola]